MSWTIWLACLYAWLSDIVHGVVHERYGDLWVFLGLVLLLYIVYLSEGIEIAVTDLKDKDPAQLRDASMRALLAEIKPRMEAFFIPQQQTVALFVVTSATLIASQGFTTLYVFPFGTWDNSYYKIDIINFIAISMSTLCVCQIPAKRLALRNSEQFLGQARWLWRLIQIAGILDLPAPSNFITDKLNRWLKFSERRLPPSRAHHYNATALIHGYCLDQLAMRIDLNDDGSALLSRHYLTLYLHGAIKDQKGYMRAGVDDQPVPCDRKLLAAWKMDPVEDLQQYEQAFDRIFAAGVTGASMTAELEAAGFEAIDLAAEFLIETTDPTNPRFDWSMRFLRGLPEDFVGGDSQKIVGCLYQVKGTAPPGAFFFGNKTDYWNEKFVSACRRLHFAVYGTGTMRAAFQGCEVRLDLTETELHQEAARASAALKRHGFVPYPVQSALYTLCWETMST